MVALRKWARWSAGLAIAGFCLPLVPAAAQQTAGRAGHGTAPPALVRDVELAYGGLLVGRMLDANGRPVASKDVSIRTDNHTLASTRTDAEGVFAVAKLHGGVHEIVTDDSVQICRLWANGTAPPRTPQSIDVVSGENVVRGQWGPPPGNHLIEKAKVWATNPLVIGGVVATAIALPIALSDNGGPHS